MTLRELITQHTMSVTGLACLGARLDAIASNRPLDPALDARVTEVLDVMGMSGALEGVTAPEAGQFCNEIRQVLACDESLLYAESRATSWIPNDKQVLQSVGDFSRGFARGLTRMFIPQLDGLQARLAADGAAFLDVGVGVAGLACEMATLWPKLRITGLEVWAPSLALAHATVAAAGLADRVTLREQAAETLADEDAYDLAWLPIIFMPQKIVPASFASALRALRPGGWLVTSLANIEGTDASAAMWRLRTTMFGGPMWTLGELRAQLATAGFADVRVLPTPPGAPALVAARRGYSAS